MQSNKTIIITTAILILTILGAGCTDTGGANPGTTTYTPPPPEEVPVVEETAAAEPISEPTAKPLIKSQKTWQSLDYGMVSPQPFSTKTTQTTNIYHPTPFI